MSKDAGTPPIESDIPRILRSALCPVSDTNSTPSHDQTNYARTCHISCNRLECACSSDCIARPVTQTESHKLWMLQRVTKGNAIKSECPYKSWLQSQRGSPGHLAGYRQAVPQRDSPCHLRTRTRASRHQHAALLMPSTGTRLHNLGRVA